MSKTTQRRAAAFGKGYSDAKAGKPSKWNGDRALKNTYKEGHACGLSERSYNHRVRERQRLGLPDPVLDDLGPDPVQHEVPRPFRGF